MYSFSSTLSAYRHQWRHNVYVQCIPFLLLFLPTDINECESSPCQNTASCWDRINKYKCVCKAGYVGNKCHIGELFLYLHDRCINLGTIALPQIHVYVSLWNSKDLTILGFQQENSFISCLIPFLQQKQTTIQKHTQKHVEVAVSITTWLTQV